MPDDLPETQPQICDFYFSEKQKKLLGNLCHSVQGKEFTQVVAIGKKPIGSFDDFVLVVKGIEYNSENVLFNPKLIDKLNTNLIDESLAYKRRVGTFLEKSCPAKFKRGSKRKSNVFRNGNSI
jgi:hypothetical protein